MDVCLFLDSEYQHKHSGTMLPDGSHISAPQSLSNARSALAGVFISKGAVGHGLTPTGLATPATAFM